MLEISEDSQILNTLENFGTSLEYDHAQFRENLMLNTCPLGRCLSILWKSLVDLQLKFFQVGH